MYLDPIPNRNGTFTYLIRRSHRVGQKIVKTTLANVTPLGPDIMPDLQRLLRGGKVVNNIQEVFDVLSNKAHDHVAAVLGMMEQLGLPALIAPKNTRFRRLVLGMIAARVLQPASKLATSSLLDKRSCPSTLKELLKLQCVDEDHLYEAMDTLALQKTRIECALVKKHLGEGGLVLYDTTSSSVEGTPNEWAADGYHRDKKKDKQPIVIGLMTDGQGCPVSVEVFPGKTSETATLGTPITKIQKIFGLQQVVLVGDRGILQQKPIQQEVLPVGLDWITGMNQKQIERVLLAPEAPRRWFDETHLMEVEHRDFPHDRLILCRNLRQAQHHREKRQAFITKTKEKRDAIVAATQREQRTLKDQAAIGLRLGRVANQYRMNPYVVFDIREKHFSYPLHQTHLQKAEAMDWMERHPFEFKKKAASPSFGAKRQAINHRRHGLSSHEVAIPTDSSDPSSQESTSGGPCVVMHAVLRCAVPLATETGPTPFCRRGFGAKASRSTRSHHTGQADATSSKEGHHEKEGTKTPSQEFGGLMEEISGLNRLVIQPKIAIKEQKEVIMMDGQTPIQKEAFQWLNIQSL